jgi:hypothetical protein
MYTYTHTRDWITLLVYVMYIDTLWLKVNLDLRTLNEIKN